MTALSSLVVAAAPGASGCSVQGRVRTSGEHPVRTVDSTHCGVACAPDGEEPPAGYERSPAGRTPEFVDDVHPD